MATDRTMPARVFAALLLALCIAATLGVPGAHAATDPFPMTEPFTNATFSGPDWHTGGVAYLTASGSGTQKDVAGAGWLRLTDPAGNQFGYVVDDTAFPSDNGILVNFDYATYGGNGADGLSFFLYDGATAYDASFHVGASGGSLGYAPCTDSSGFRAGVPNAYIGVGFDEFGNFTNLGSICGLDGTTKQPNTVSVRGSAADDYKLLTSVATAPELLTGDRTKPRHVTVSVTPDLKLSVYIRYPDGTYQTIAKNEQLPSDHVPSTLKFGFAGSTGGSTNAHEIRNTDVVKPADLTTHVSSPQHTFGTDTYTWTVTVANSDDNDTLGDTVRMTSPQGGLSDISWTCTTDAAAAVCPPSGTGLPDTTADLPKGATATYTVTAHTAASASSASLQADAQPTGATGELNPTDNVAAIQTETDPANVTRPTFTVSDIDGLTGDVSATPGTYDGADLTVSDHWQQCDPGDPTGATCTDIPGATGTSFTLALRDKALRLRETAGNSAGSVDAFSGIYDARPDTSLTSAPASVTASTTAAFTATSDALGGAAFEYQLDGGAWTANGGAYTGLADGRHTVKARAVYAGLADLTPDSHTWTVDTTAPAAPKVSFPAEGLVSRDTAPTVTLIAEPGSDVAVDVDGAVHHATADKDGHAAVTVAGPLADGPHTVRAQATDTAGNTGDWSAVTTWTVKTSTHGELTGPADGPTATSRPTVTFTGEPGAAYEVKVDGKAVATGVIDVTGQGSLQVPVALADGDHVISVTVTDAAGNQDTKTMKVTVDTTGPDAIRFVRAPARDSSQHDATFMLTGEPGATLQCSLDGATWTACASPPTFTGLADGPHVLHVRAVDEAGNVSADQQYAWTVDTTKPAPPAVLGGPDAQTRGTTARFRFTPEPGATLRCSVDDRRSAACPSILALTGLKVGKHTLRVRQTDAAGNLSRVTVYEWTVMAKPKTGKARRVTAVLGKATTASDGRVAAVGCNLDAGALISCQVTLRSHGRRIGRATERVHRAKARTVVRVKLGPRGRRLLGRALGGLPVTAKALTRSRDGRVLRDRVKGTLYPPTVFSVPVLFDTDRFTMDRLAARVVRDIARDVRHAKAVTCEGYTDSRAPAAYNHRLGLDRARTVCRRLRALGVRARPQAISYGETRPAAGNRTPRGRRLNRRVLVRVSY